MTQLPKVSAIVSAYFAEEFLQRRLENLLYEQTCRPEVIVICQEGSKEDAIASKFEEDLPDYVIVGRTLGIPSIYEAWNHGVVRATGEFLTNANSDDWLRPNALEIMAHELAKHPKYAVVYGNQEIIKEIDGPVTGLFDWIEGGLEELLRGCFLGPQPMWRKCLHADYGLFDPDLQVAGDYEFWLRIAAKGEKFLHLRAPVGKYLDRKNSAEHRESLRTTWETVRVRAKYRKEN